MLEKILITGINGMLGSKVYSFLKSIGRYDIYGIGRKNNFLMNPENYFKGDLLDENFIKDISIINFDIIIHTAAIVDLGYCEKNRTEAFDNHVIASELLVKYNTNTIFFYISTDSVYDGSKGNYNEEYPTKPLNQYSLTKFLGENSVRENINKFYILRLNVFGFKLPYSNSLFEWAYTSLKAGNSISGFSNVVFNPLYSGQIAEIIFLFLINKPDFGIYNIGSAKDLTKYDFIIEIAKKFNFSLKLITETNANFDLGIPKRPYNTFLDVSKFKSVFPNYDLSIKSGLNQLEFDINQSNLKIKNSLI